ncbi:MerR family transcriptional regulator [Neomoorella mulderi]|uniref:HTH-type transcriptional regulator GlnR n=1 Tax=Moorella mulderi DSM 14980 TaxID=1122241 RepID=A0A151AV93_9FIRM|nr:MerR family transcriptional regulator [Moorella mulderi]KYH31589.1 HTH-type transcriptional regulator GlnR [Moorella mulderi DSM 14980]
MYPIGMVIQVLDISPHRLRRWERKGLVVPTRKNGRRCYSELDLQRLMFIKRLLEGKHCRLADLPHYLAFYPCWQDGKCISTPLEEPKEGARPCWQKKNWYCPGQVP